MIPMHKTLCRRWPGLPLLLALLLFLIVPVSGHAVGQTFLSAKGSNRQECLPPSAAPIPLALSMKGFFTAPTRSRIVQICVVAMSLALFIMMRKLTGGGPTDRCPRSVRDQRRS